MQEPSLTDSTDIQLVERTLAGDQDAYKHLVGRYQGHVHGLAYSLVGNWSDAQDIAQETFIRAYANLDQLKDANRFAAWLRRVAFSVSMNWLKAFRPGLFEQLDGRVDLDRLEIPDFQPGPQETAQKRELANAVLRAVESLPPKYRMPLTMFHLDGLSYQKVADFMDIPLGTIKSLIHRARGKLKTALGAVMAEEVTPMVQEVFNEHKLPAEFAARTLENVPILAWGKGKECTFAGALEAATAATEHPHSYANIMGWTGLAFRVRWWKPGERSRWCPSCAVGEMEEEIQAADKATGWRLRTEVHMAEPDMEKYAGDIVASINSGRPVPAYSDMEDMAVIYGYRDGGKTLLYRDYFKGETPHELPAKKMGWLWILLGEHGEPMKQPDALVQAMTIAVHNWNRRTGRSGPGEYWYGQAAYDAWMGDLAKAEAEGRSEQEWKLFAHVNRWNFSALGDARKAAIAFLRQNAALLPAPARSALERAADVYARQVEFFASSEFSADGCFLGPAPPQGTEAWTQDARDREIDLLAKTRDFDASATAEIESALAAVEGG